MTSPTPDSIHKGARTMSTNAIRETVRAEVRAGLLEEPTEAEIFAEADDAVCTAACPEGCRIEPDGMCPHGRPSWVSLMLF